MNSLPTQALTELWRRRQEIVSQTLRENNKQLRPAEEEVMSMPLALLLREYERIDGKTSKLSQHQRELVGVEVERLLTECARVVD